MGNLSLSIIRVGSDKDISVDDIAKGIQKAIDLKADIINISLGAYEDNRLLRDSIKLAVYKGIIVVCAAGNDCAKKYLYPASYGGVISVSSVDQNGIALLNNNFNDKVTISASGEKVPSMVNDEDGHEIFETGSSPASAIITSIIAMMKTIDNKLSVNDIKKIFQNTASRSEDRVQNYSDFYGFGIVNYKKSVMYAKSSFFYHMYEFLEKLTSKASY
jgi:subtilisin family serine protease